LNSENKTTVEVNQGSHPISKNGEAMFENAYSLSLPHHFFPKLPGFKPLSEHGGDGTEATQASDNEALSRLDVTFEDLQPDSKPTTEFRNIRKEFLLTTTPKSLGHGYAAEENQTLENSVQEGITHRSSSSDNESSNSPDLLPEQPEEEQPTVQLKDLSPELLVTGAYGIHKFINNYVLELPVPEAVLKAIPRTNHKEYTHTRFTFVTCSPYLMVRNRYCLRPTFYTSTPVTKFILALEMNFVTGIHVKQTWKLMHDAIAYAERKLGPDTWKQVRVHIHFRGHTHKNWSQFLEKIGAIQNFNIPPQPVLKQQVLDEALTQDTMEVAGRRVQGTMQEGCQRLCIFV